MAKTQAVGTEDKKTKDPRDLRLRNQYFPGAEDLVFDTQKKGFVPLPIILRKLMRHISASELRILMYLQTRCSKYGICYPTSEEMAHDLLLNGPRNLTPHIKTLEAKKFIARKTGAGRTYYLVHDPIVAIRHMADSGTISAEDLFGINELLGELSQDPVTAKTVKTILAVMPELKKQKTNSA